MWRILGGIHIVSLLWSCYDLPVVMSTQGLNEPIFSPAPWVWHLAEVNPPHFVGGK